MRPRPVKSYAGNSRSDGTGPLRLVNANITGEFTMRGMHLKAADTDGDALVADGMKVGGNVFLDSSSDEGPFTAKGAIRLQGVDITGSLIMRGARLKAARTDGDALVADGMKVRGDALLDSSGDRHGGEDSRHLLAALDHAHGVVLGQVEVAAKTNEIPLFTTLLDRIQITGAVITADALHAQREHATYLHRRCAHYLLIVKRNQPGLHAQLAALPWRDVPKAYDKRERGHGRTERRTLKVTAVVRGLAFPHAAQAIQIVRRRKVKAKWSRETCYAVTSLTITQASYAQLAAIIRGHWGIEDRLHWIRDIDFDEDRSQVRTAAGPRVMASLRNLAITILRLSGATSIAAALRYHARQP